MGSGFSPCATLGPSEKFFNTSTKITFIDPHPDLLMSLIKEDDKVKLRVVHRRLQDGSLNEFDALQFV